MPRCFSTLGCPELTLAEAQALAARFALDGVEVRALQGSTDLPAIFARAFGSPENAARVGAGLPPMVALGTSLKLVEADAAARDSLLAFVPWAEALGVRWLRVFDGGRTASFAEFERAAATVAWWREQRATHGWRCDLMVETHDSLLDAARIGAFTEQIGHVAILWDSHHTWRRGGESPAATWAAIGASVVHLHIKDSVADRTHRDGFRYVLPGTGEFPMTELRRALDATHFAGAMSLEWERLWHPELPPLEAALESARAHGWL